MKIAFTVADCNAYAHVGGEVERVTAIVEIPDEQLPAIVRRFMAGTGPRDYKSMSLSIVAESTARTDAEGE